MTVKDRWHTTDNAGNPVPTITHGRGRRWEVAYRDQPDGPLRRRGFDDQDEAERFNRDMDCVLRGDLAGLSGVA